MGRHTTTRSRAPRPPLLAGLAVLLVAVVAGSLVWWVRTDGDDVAAGSCSDRQTVRVTVAPEVGALAEQLLAEPQPLGDGSCAVAQVTAEEPLQTLAALGALDAGSLPQVWVPDSSLWAARPGNAGLDPAGSLASSPLVLATSRATADALGWTQTTPTWGQALTTDRPLAMPDLASTAEGLSAVAAVRQSLGADADADNAVVQAVLAADRAGTPAPADALAAAGTGGADAPLVPVTEQQLIETVHGDDASQLVAVYPSDGSPAMDYPVLRVAAAGTGDQAAVDAVVEALTSGGAGDQVRAAGFWDTAGGAPEGTGSAGVRDVAPETMQLDPVSVQALLGRLSSLTAPARLLTVIDVSASMEAPAGDGTRATLARDAAKSALTLLPDRFSGGLWVFAYHLDGDRDWVQLAPLRAFGDDAGGQTQRELIDEQFDSIPGLLTAGGTGLYDTTLAAVRAGREAYDPAAVNTVVLITDGADDDDPAGLGLDALLETLRSEADPVRPVKVVGIGLGPDADLSALQQIADATGGAAYPALDPADLQAVLIASINGRR